MAIEAAGNFCFGMDGNWKDVSEKNGWVSDLMEVEKSSC